MAEFRKAERKRGYAKVALIGASGSGKTWTGIEMLRGLVGENEPIAVADTENGSAEFYSQLTNFDICIIEPDYTIAKFQETVDSARENGYKGLLVDGLSSFWVGKGGLLDQKVALEKRGRNSFTAWNDITPMYNQMVDTILNTKMHIVFTMRAKTDYSMITENGQTRVVKQGLAPIQRENLDFEFLVVFMLDQQHKASVSKDRTGLFAHRGIFDVGKQTGIEIKNWLESGVELPEEPAQKVTPEKLQKTAEIFEKGNLFE